MVRLRLAETDRLSEYFELWLAAQEAKNLSPQTLACYRETVQPFVEYLRREVDTPDAVTAQHIRAYLLQRKRTGIRPATLNNAHRMARQFWRWLLREGLTANDPFHTVERPQPERRVKPALTPEQVERILNACEGNDWQRRRDKALVLTLLDTGMRLRECLSLTVQDAAHEHLLIRGKGGKQRVVFLSAETRLALRKYLLSYPRKLLPTDPLWQTERGAMTKNGAQRIIAAIGRRAGISPLGAHAFRRTFATWCLRSGMDMEHLRLLMGHGDYAVLRQYLSLVESDLQRAHREHSPLNALRVTRAGECPKKCP